MTDPNYINVTQQADPTFWMTENNLSNGAHYIWRVQVRWCPTLQQTGLAMRTLKKMIPFLSRLLARYRIQNVLFAEFDQENLPRRRGTYLKRVFSFSKDH
jgi:hypothetical protein